jgi:hypothetical protein
MWNVSVVAQPSAISKVKKSTIEKNLKLSPLVRGIEKQFNKTDCSAPEVLSKLVFLPLNEDGKALMKCNSEDGSSFEVTLVFQLSPDGSFTPKQINFKYLVGGF